MQTVINYNSFMTTEILPWWEKTKKNARLSQRGGS